jgi:putative flippase GtrA
MEAVRFTLVAIGGVILDLSIAYVLAVGVGLPLWLAATAGFMVAALANYIAHELWTFGAAGGRVSARRAAQYLSASALTLVARIMMVFLLRAWFGSTAVLPILIAAAGVSFAVNFAVSKYLIFNRKPKACKANDD